MSWAAELLNSVTVGARDWNWPFGRGKIHRGEPAKCKSRANGQLGHVPGGSVGKHLTARISFVDGWYVMAGNPEWIIVSLVLEFTVLAEQIGPAKTAFAELASATFAGWIARRKFAAANSANSIACTLCDIRKLMKKLFMKLSCSNQLSEKVELNILQQGRQNILIFLQSKDVTLF